MYSALTAGKFFLERLSLCMMSVRAAAVAPGLPGMVDGIGKWIADGSVPLHSG
jgi:hypothetical protein